MSRPKKSNYFFYDFVRLTAMSGMLLFRPKRLYADESARRRIRGGAIIIANHFGHFDPIFLMMAIWYRRHHFVCIKDFFDGKFRNWLFTQFHCIPIDRENFSMASLRQITEELRQGHLISMYPEGKVNTSSQIAPFKSGVALIAYRSGKPIIPVYIPPRKHWYDRLIVGIGPAMYVAEALGAQPSLANISKVIADLEETEQNLAALVENTTKKGGRS